MEKRSKAQDFFDENLLFMRQFIKNPMRLGSIIPSSNTLADFMARHIIRGDDEYVLELGAGTGRFTSAILRHGIPANKLLIVEQEPKLAAFLRKKFPDVTVIESCATQLHNVMPKSAHGHISTIVSGIPMVNISKKVQANIVDSCFNVSSLDAQFLQFTYGPLPPLACKKTTLSRARLGRVMKNFPPATVWAYWQSSAVALA